MLRKPIKFLLILLIISGTSLSIAAYRSIASPDLTLSFLSNERIESLTIPELEEYPLVAVLESEDRNVEWVMGVRQTSATENYDLIRVEQYRGEPVDYSTSAGTEIVIEEEVYTVQEVRPWVGLMYEASGEPRINLAISMDDGESWIENQIMGSGEWLHTGILGVWFVRHDSDAESSSFLNDSALLTRDRKWGVRDGNRVHWFTSFVPGTGVERDDGAVVSLLGVKVGETESDVAILELMVDFGNDEARQLHHVDQGKGDLGTEQAFYYLDPGSSEFTAVYSVVHDEEVNFALFRNGEFVHRGHVESGETVEVIDSSIRLRVDQVMLASEEVKKGQSDFREALLRGEDRILRIRQGATTRVGDTELRYIQGVTQSVFSFEGIVTEPKVGSAFTHFTLAPDESMELFLGGVKYELLAENIVPGEEVRFVAFRIGLIRHFFWFPGVLAGLCLLVMMRLSYRV